MKGLLLKDFYVLFKQQKLLLFIIPAMSLIGGISLATITIFLGAALTTTALAYDERSKWDELATMLPYSRISLVTSKYLLSYFFTITAMLLSILGCSALPLFSFTAQDPSINVILFAFSCALIFVAFNLPIIFHFGSEKGRLVFIITMALGGGFVGAINSVNIEFLKRILTLPPIIMFAIAVVVNLISIQISINIKRKKA